MFQIEPVLWLQSFESPSLTWLMTQISLLGYMQAYVAIVLILTFVYRLRAGLCVLTALIVCGLAVDTLKSSLQLPRPMHADDRVRDPVDQITTALVARGGAGDPWSLPSQEVIAAVRASPAPDYGLPSGHAATATCLTLTIWLVFRARALAILALGWPILMSCSRIYLGRHFVADVAAGALVGVIAAILAVCWLGPQHLTTGIDTRRALRWLAAALVLAATALWIPALNAGHVGRLLGLTATLVLLSRWGVPADDARVWQRLARLGAAAGLYWLSTTLIGAGQARLDWGHAPLGKLLATTLGTLLTFAGAVLVAMRAKWYVSSTGVGS
jgi:membrane-associated phospholipid phosphatase